MVLMLWDIIVSGVEFCHNTLIVSINTKLQKRFMNFDYAVKPVLVNNN